MEGICQINSHRSSHLFLVGNVINRMQFWDRGLIAAIYCPQVSQITKSSWITDSGDWSALTFPSTLKWVNETYFGYINITVVRVVGLGNPPRVCTDLYRCNKKVMKYKLLGSSHSMWEWDGYDWTYILLSGWITLDYIQLNIEYKIDWRELRSK